MQVNQVSEFMTTEEIFASLKPDINTVAKLRESLITTVPAKRNLINQIFDRYGK